MIVLQVNQIHKSFGAEEIISGAKLEVQHRDRVALVGRNGAGKSTLLKIIAGEMSYDSGDLIMPKDLTIGYLEQQTDLNSDATVWQEMMKIFSHFRDQEAKLRQLEAAMADPAVYSDAERNAKVMQEYDLLQTHFKDAGGYQFEADTRAVLHGMKFYPEDYEKKITSLSGGQKTRLMLAKLLLAKPQLLILDEPTNHLDIDSKEVLEQALEDYPGTLLFVSHDRYFINRIANRIMQMDDKRLAVFEGDYTYFLEKQEEMKVRREDEASPAQTASQTKMDYQSQKLRRNEIRRLERELDALEEDMHVIEDEIGALELKLTEPEIYNDYEKAQIVNTSLIEKNDAFDHVINQYEAMENDLERLLEESN